MCPNFCSSWMIYKCLMQKCISLKQNFFYLIIFSMFCISAEENNRQTLLFKKIYRILNNTIPVIMKRKFSIKIRKTTSHLKKLPTEDQYIWWWKSSSVLEQTHTCDGVKQITTTSDKWLSRSTTTMLILTNKQ
jgi:hypothetical protein